MIIKDEKEYYTPGELLKKYDFNYAHQKNIRLGKGAAGLFQINFIQNGRNFLYEKNSMDTYIHFFLSTEPRRLIKK